MTEVTAAAPRAGARQWLGLGVPALPSTLLFIMLTILILTAPPMAINLEPTSTQLLWILNIYGFVMAGFLDAMGFLGDRIGKRFLVIVGALTIGASPSPGASPPESLLVRSCPACCWSCSAGGRLSWSLCR